MNEHAVEQAIKSVESRLGELEESFAKSDKEFRLVLGGDLTGKNGVLQNQVRMINALFDEKEGVVPRLTAMERRELERTGWIKGAYFAWGILGTIIGFLLSKYVIK